MMTTNIQPSLHTLNLMSVVVKRVGSGEAQRSSSPRRLQLGSMSTRPHIAPWRPLFQKSQQCNAWILAYLHSLAESIPRIVVLDTSALSHGIPNSPDYDSILFELHDGQQLAVPMTTSTTASERPVLRLQHPHLASFVNHSQIDDDVVRPDTEEVNERVYPPISSDVLEIAMCISEEIARLSNAPSPIPTNMPILFADLDDSAVRCLNSWLITRYNWKDDISTLTSPNVSSETLACDITNVPSTIRVKEPVPPPQRRRRPRRNLSVTVPKPEIVSLVPTASSVISAQKFPAPAYQTPSVPMSKNGDDIVLNLGMASYESWTGKKSGIIVGLMTLGALFGSPISNSFGQMRHQRTPFDRSTHAFLDIRSPPVEHTSILSPWLDVLHFHGHEPVQSPWIADQAQSDFPLSP
ncbi:hypothetical protein QCA50_007164 [Cerrena zonata]|uniref:Uncharacterized protein n=1 Tax=Cerrena zonata TaxID=2478898 RepID=A0AAW0GCW2_9APHY